VKVLRVVWRGCWGRGRRVVCRVSSSCHAASIRRMAFHPTLYWSAAGERVSRVARVTRTHRRVVYNGTLRVVPHDPGHGSEHFWFIHAN
jgi:hypothetical protein